MRISLTSAEEWIFFASRGRDITTASYLSAGTDLTPKCGLSAEQMMTENSEKENEPQNRVLQRSPSTTSMQPVSKVSAVPQP